MTSKSYIYVTPHENVDLRVLEQDINSATEKAQEAISDYWRSMQGRPDPEKFATFVADNLVTWTKHLVEDYASESEVRERELILEYVTENPGREMSELAEWMTVAGRDLEELDYLLDVGRLHRRTTRTTPLAAGVEVVA